jgi:metal-dependent hydrolase (beta-lactamase superfamily II)
MCQYILQAAFSVLALQLPLAYSQDPGLRPHTNFSTFFEVTEFPNAQTENVSLLLNEAVELAKPDLEDLMEYRCILGQRYRALLSAQGMPGFVKPTMAFDGVYFVGQNWVSSWAIDTGEGLVLIDALDNVEQAERIIVPGLQAFGYEPTDLKAVFITHEHFDHFGGARWLQDTYNIPTYASATAWDNMAHYEIDGGPRRDQIMVDGEEFKLGNLTMRFIATPGHTPGCTSLVFNVRDGEKKYMAAINGGAGINSNVTQRAEQVLSNYKLAIVIENNNVSVMIANHPTQDRAVTNFDILEARDCQEGECKQQNPFVIGTEAFSRYLRTMALCTRLQSARDGVDMPDFIDQ